VKVADEGQESADAGGGSAENACFVSEMGDDGLSKRIINLQQAEMIKGYVPFNWGLSFTAVPIPIKMPSCIVRILSCEAPTLRIEGGHQTWAVIAHQ
jgi:hypothetical protein